MTAAAPDRGVSERPVPAELLYGRLLATAASHLLGAGPPPRARLRLADGSLQALPLDRWLGPVERADRAVLRRAVAPVLDIGCGPGRHLAALTAAGKAGLGVDLSPAAVRLARRRGADAIPGSVFDDVPHAGRWRTALLLDGNVGIGGAPAALLARTRELLAPGGAVLVEVEPPGAPSALVRVRIEAPGAVSEWFPWARIGLGDIAALARRAGLVPARAFGVDGRWFIALRRPRARADRAAGARRPRGR